MMAVCILSGSGLILLVLAEAFEVLVLPRRVTRPYRLTRLYYRNAWRAWGALGDLLPAGRRRESFLSVFGPLSLLALFAFWAGGLVLGFALVQYPLVPEPPRFVDMIYFSGTTFTTLGYGDMVPAGTAARLLAVLEAATGFGLFAVVI